MVVLCDLYVVMCFQFVIDRVMTMWTCWACLVNVRAVWIIERKSFVAGMDQNTVHRVQVVEYIHNTKQTQSEILTSQNKLQNTATERYPLFEIIGFTQSQSNPPPHTHTLNAIVTPPAIAVSPLWHQHGSQPVTFHGNKENTEPTSCGAISTTISKHMTNISIWTSTIM